MVDQLFPEENFYFFKIFKDSDKDSKIRNELEQKQLLKLINDCQSSGRYFIDEGLFEPIHLIENERQFLFEGMQTSIANIVEEVVKSNQICK